MQDSCDDGSGEFNELIDVFFFFLIMKVLLMLFPRLGLEGFSGSPGLAA